MKTSASAESGRVGLFAAFCLALLFVLFELARAYYADGIEIRVEGNLSPQEREQLNALLDPYVRTSVFMLDTEEFVRDVGSLPWVGTVEVRPEGLNKVSVKLSHSLSQRLTKPARTLVNKLRDLAPPDGASLSIRRSELDLRVAGQEPPDREFVFFAFDVMLEELGLRLEEVELDALGHLELHLEDAKTLVLGTSEPTARLQRFAHIYQSGLKEDWLNVDRVDTRYRDGASVRWAKANLMVGKLASLSEARVE